MWRSLFHCLLRKRDQSLSAWSRFDKRNRKGHAVVELSLLMPWAFFLFAGALDFGFFSHDLISVQNAARVAALNAGFSATSAASQTEACFHVRRELAAMPNAQSFSAGCSAAPLVVTVSPVVDSENAPSSRIRVTYETIPAIPIPGLVSGTQTISRTVDVRVFGE